MPEIQYSKEAKQHWLITGASGLLGHALSGALIRQGHNVTALRGNNTVDVIGTREIQIDVTEEASVRRTIENSSADIVVHAAGLTNVDECERSPDAARRAHVDATRHVASAAEAIGARLIYISTDHLWDGTRAFVDETTTPYPINVYARTKLQGEQIALASKTQALAVRTNFFGRGRPWRRSLSDWILERLSEGATLNMFTDSFFTPISLDHLCGCIMELATKDATGVLHVAGKDRISKFDFACALANAAGYPAAPIKRASVATFGLTAPRPHDMSLDTSRAASLLGHAMPNIDESIATLFANVSTPSRQTSTG